MLVLYNKLTVADIDLTLFKNLGNWVRLNKDITSPFYFLWGILKQLSLTLAHF